MSLTRMAVEKAPFTWFAAGLLAVAGLAGYFSLGRLEDPDFTIKTAAIMTTYPGASPQEVEQEVTDRIEQAIQEMPELKNVSSMSRAGQSLIRVDIRDEIRTPQMPQVWDTLRRKIRDIETRLPPGCGRPEVSDDFGDVYGFVLAVTGDGYSYAELEQYVKFLKKELSVVKGVARVELWGVQDQVVYVDVSESRMAELGVSPAGIKAVLNRQNMVVDGGAVDMQNLRPRFEVAGSFKSPREIENLSVPASATDPVRPTSQRSRPGELFQLRDVATVRRGYADPPRWQMRYDGQPALGLALTHIAGSNVVDLGKAVDRRLEELQAQLPVGIECHKVNWASDQVQESIQGFIVNLFEAVLIVLVVLWLTMGLRQAIIIGGGGLILVILATLTFMKIFGIDLHRISLGALIIAMGMMVDNAIVVVDNFLVFRQQGMSRIDAAVQSASRPSWPLLGATVIACMAFYPIFASPKGTGEFAGALFSVTAISLMISWVLAVTIVPLMCLALLPDPKTTDGGALYGGAFYRTFRWLLGGAIRFRWPFLGTMAALLVVAVLGFSQVRVLFFPDSTRTQFMIDYWAPEGTRLLQTSEEIKVIEKKLRDDPEFKAHVKNYTTFVGQGPPRFYLPVDPESPYSSYGQIIVNTNTYPDVDQLIAKLDKWLGEAVPRGTMVRLRKYGVGPGDTWKIEARFSGPAEADPKVLKELGARGVKILQASPGAQDVRTNWREPVSKVQLQYDQSAGRWTGVTRDDVAGATKRSFDGVPVGLFREGDDLIPIVVRSPEGERTGARGLDLLPVRSGSGDKSVPLSQVVAGGEKGIEVKGEDPIIWRWDRRRAVTVQCSPRGVTAPMLRNGVLQEFEAIPLPPGYKLEWDGEYDSTKTSQEGLLPGIGPALAIMALILVALFNGFRPPLIIVLTIPFAIIGIASGLLLTQTPFGFMALLGAMSLSGMMIKNAIVLLDQIPAELAAGKSPYRAVVDAAVSRLMPVINAAATTVLGMAPLLQDVFWVGLAVTIMFGLTFGTVLTMIVVPVLYACFYRIPIPAAADVAAAGTPPTGPPPTGDGATTLDRQPQGEVTP
jgi:multidrug efflux pump subunit AcrB